MMKKSVDVWISCDAWSLRRNLASELAELHYNDTFVIDLTVANVDELWSIFNVYLGPEMDSTGTRDSR